MHRFHTIPLLGRSVSFEPSWEAAAAKAAATKAAEVAAAQAAAAQAIGELI